MFACVYRPMAIEYSFFLYISRIDCQSFGFAGLDDSTGKFLSLHTSVFDYLMMVICELFAVCCMRLCCCLNEVEANQRAKGRVIERKAYSM